jgi:hypothetical protein
MKNALFGMVLLAGIAMGGACPAAFTEPSAHLATFASDRPGAISYTFDDNLRDQYTLAVPMLNEVGFNPSEQSALVTQF